jgi:hypothetical protein
MRKKRSRCLGAYGVVKTRRRHLSGHRPGKREIEKCAKKIHDSPFMVKTGGRLQGEAKKSFFELFELSFPRSREEGFLPSPCNHEAAPGVSADE